MATSAHRFDLLVFDWDGTLYDSTALIVSSIQAACEDLGLARPSAEVAAYVIGMGLYDALAHAVPALPKNKVPELAARYRHHYVAQQDGLSLFPGILELLHNLKNRAYGLAIATGKSRQGLNEALRHVSLQGLFDSTRTADETRSKPHPRMLLELMEELGVPPERTLMIGDTTHDLQLAENAGVASLGVSYGAHPHENFLPFNPRFIAHSVTDLGNWLYTHA